MSKKTVKIRYAKAYDFKAILATGIYGGLTGTGLVNANFFTDRIVLPDYQDLDIDESGRALGTPRDSKDGDIMREVQVGVIMDVNTAKIVVEWLQSKIAEFEKVQNEQ